MLSALVGVFLALQTGPVGKPPVGIYRVEWCDKNGKNLSPSNLPVGQKRWMEVHPNKRWILRDFLSGFEGTWKKSKTGFDLLALVGPAGKLKKPETMKLKLIKANVYEFFEPKNPSNRMRFYYDPQFLKTLSKEYEKALRGSGHP